MELVNTWYDPKTETWLTYTGEFNSYAEALKTIKEMVR